jgi:hypothetical protein
MVFVGVVDVVFGNITAVVFVGVDVLFIVEFPASIRGSFASGKYGIAGFGGV